jgi:hypothetical protein
VERVSVKELKMQFAAEFGVMGLDTEFLAGLAHGRLQGGFTRINAPPRAIDFAGPKAPLFADEQDPAITNHKKQDSPLGGLP